MNFNRVVFGVRDDFDLNQRWWHRLLKVCGILILSGFALLVGIVWYSGEAYRPKVGDVQVLISLDKFILKNDEAGRTDHSIAFEALQGTTGIKQDGRIVFTSLYQANCGFFEFTDEVPAGVVPDPPTKGSSPVCSGITGDPALADVVKYEFTWLGRLRLSMQAIGTGLFWAYLGAIPLLNLYYRGIVYVICGPRRKTASSEAV